MKKFFYRTTSLFLTFCMLFGALPECVSASTQTSASASLPSLSASLAAPASLSTIAQASDFDATDNIIADDLSLEGYLIQQLDDMPLMLDQNDFMMAFGLPLPITPSKPIPGDVLTLSGGSIA